MLTILVGKSASGKDAILKELLKKGFEKVVTTTTRPKRVGEINGKDYNFISDKDFISKISNEDFIEYKSYEVLENGKPNIWYYGSPKESIDVTKNQVIILELDGTEKFLKLYRENCLVYYIDVPDNVRLCRAKERGSFDQTEWDRRAITDEEIFSPKRLNEICDVTLDNTINISEVVKKIQGINGIIKNCETIYIKNDILIIPKTLEIEEGRLEEDEDDIIGEVFDFKFSLFFLKQNAQIFDFLRQDKDGAFLTNFLKRLKNLNEIKKLTAEEVVLMTLTLQYQSEQELEQELELEEDYLQHFLDELDKTSRKETVKYLLEQRFVRQ